MIDLQILGNDLRAMRIEAGYERAEDFSKAIYEQTGVEISKQSIYNIESGKTEIKLSAYLAMLVTARKSGFINIDNVIYRSIDPDQQDKFMSVNTNFEVGTDENMDIQIDLGNPETINLKDLREISELAETTLENSKPALEHIGKIYSDAIRRMYDNTMNDALKNIVKAMQQTNYNLQVQLSDRLSDLSKTIKFVTEKQAVLEASESQMESFDDKGEEDK